MHCSNIARLILGQAAGPSDDLFSDIAPWLGVLVVLVVVGAITIFLVRKRFHSDSETVGDTRQGFTLHDLRTMHAAGELSDAEFERARSAMIGRVRGDDVREEPDAAGAEDDQSPQDQRNDEPADESR